MTVFVTNAVSLNLEPARQYGKIRVIGQGFVYVDMLWPDDRIPDDIAWGLQQAAQIFNVPTDYLLLAGDHLQVAHLSALIQHYQGEFRVLRWDRIAQGYAVSWVGAAPQALSP